VRKTRTGLPSELARNIRACVRADKCLAIHLIIDVNADHILVAYTVANTTPRKHSNACEERGELANHA
jgi:hypothetical protein